MGASAKRKPKTEANLDKDDILGELLGQVKTSTSQSKSYSSAFGKPKTPITLTKLKQGIVNACDIFSLFFFQTSLLHTEQKQMIQLMKTFVHRWPKDMRFIVLYVKS